MAPGVRGAGVSRRAKPTLKWALGLASKWSRHPEEQPFASAGASAALTVLTFGLIQRDKAAGVGAVYELS